MKKVMFAFIIASTIIGCSKEETIVSNPPVVTNNPTIPIAEKHMPLAIGNYWVYETISIDTLGNETTSNLLDSVYIDRDTVFNNNTYYILSGKSTTSHVLGRTIRNTNGKIVNLDINGIERTLFSSNNLGSVYYADSVYSGSIAFYTTINTSPSLITKNTLSGSYNCYEGITNYIPNNPPIPINSKSEKRYYEKSVGVVAGQYTYLLSPNVFELRLLRYHLN